MHIRGQALTPGLVLHMLVSAQLHYRLCLLLSARPKQQSRGFFMQARLGLSTMLLYHL
jgi:hypothetical protein